ncbi:myelin protein zero-like protein 1 [Vulpes lagopus]|uniref:myelin protein zero-like protein 1 n=1 Tax=Vulpes lagopus TaxID=494514 RepID=UPI001BC9FAA4|nr:myelin protein zero-like protein 1 [Vulpes lagopus]
MLGKVALTPRLGVLPPAPPAVSRGSRPRARTGAERSRTGPLAPSEPRARRGLVRLRPAPSPRMRGERAPGPTPGCVRGPGGGRRSPVGSGEERGVRRGEAEGRRREPLCREWLVGLGGFYDTNHSGALSLNVDSPNFRASNPNGTISDRSASVRQRAGPENRCTLKAQALGTERSLVRSPAPSHPAGGQGAGAQSRGPGARGPLPTPSPGLRRDVRGKRGEITAFQFLRPQILEDKEERNASENTGGYGSCENISAVTGDMESPAPCKIPHTPGVLACFLWTGFPTCRGSMQAAGRANERAAGAGAGRGLPRGPAAGSAAWRCQRARARAAAAAARPRFLLQAERGAVGPAAQRRGGGGGGGGGVGRTMAALAGAAAVLAAAARRRWLWLVLAAVLGLLTTDASGLEVYTPKEIFVTNGTQGKLTCKFKSTNTTGTLTSVSWSFQPEGTDTTVSFFHYSQGQVYPGNYPPFKDRISWAGDLDKKDASINIENMQFIHNGTYICDVKNPPDIVVQPGHIRLYVVEKEILPVFPVWVVVGIVTAVVLGLTLLISMILAVLYRRRNSKRDYTGFSKNTSEQRVCLTEEPSFSPSPVGHLAICSTSESVSPIKQAPRKSPSDTEGLVKSLPSGSHQGPVIYAQLDHSGGHHSDKINKSESVVYADIRKN